MTKRLVIKPIASAREAGKCARLMAGLEPWITLKRNLAECRRLFSDTSLEKFSAAVDGRLAGFLLISMQGAFIGYIKAVCVAPEFRRRGIGSALIRFAEKRIFCQSPNVFLCVSTFNRNAKRFYLRLGYTVTGKLKDYLVKGSSEVLMRKNLGPKNGFRYNNRLSRDIISCVKNVF